MTFIITGCIIYLTAWIGYEMVRYGYERKVKPLMPDLIYKLEAHWELYRIQHKNKVEELKERDKVEDIEVLEEWDVVYRGNRYPESVISEEVVIFELTNGDKKNN